MTDIYLSSAASDCSTGILRRSLPLVLHRHVVAPTESVANFQSLRRVDGKIRIRDWNKTTIITDLVTSLPTLVWMNVPPASTTPL